MSGGAERACERCLARAWLVSRIAGSLDLARCRIDAVLALPDDELVAAVAGPLRKQVMTELASFDPVHARSRVIGAELDAICRCDSRYPARLRSSASSPAVLFVAGGLQRLLALAREDPVALVGARSASAYGLEVARSLGRSLASAGVTVISGMALGIDSAAHTGALTCEGRTVAVLPGPAERPYPASRRGLHRRIVAEGAAVSELMPGSSVWRWSFPARNRILAGLAATTVVVEAGRRSGSLLTAGFARALERPVGAVPGQITAPGSAGPHSLLASGAYLVRGAEDVLEQLSSCAGRTLAPDPREALGPELSKLLRAIARGGDVSAALAAAGLSAADGLAALASLELAGYVRRGPGATYTVIP